MNTPSTLDRARALTPLAEIGSSFRDSLPDMAKHASLRRELAHTLMMEAAALDKIVEGFGDLQASGLTRPEAGDEFAAHKADPPNPPNPLIRPVPTEEPPRGVDAVRAVVRDGGVWSAGEVLQELARRGWVPADVQHPQKAVETALTRLYTKYHEVERVGRGRYRYERASTGQAALSETGSAP